MIDIREGIWKDRGDRVRSVNIRKIVKKKKKNYFYFLFNCDEFKGIFNIMCFDLLYNFVVKVSFLCVFILL